MRLLVVCLVRIAGGKLALRNCDRQFSDGRSMFEAQPNGQLKMPRIGNVCVTFVGDGLKPVVQDCVEAGRDADARDKFFLYALLWRRGILRPFIATCVFRCVRLFMLQGLQFQNMTQVLIQCSIV